jgi:hypothetical protein
MPEYLAPGVFVEETSFRHRPIEGVSTSTTAFIGPTRDGPILGEPPLLTSYQEFQEVYGGMDQLQFDGSLGELLTNFVAQAVRSYFEEGGQRLYLARTFEPLGEPDGVNPPFQGLDALDGIARWSSGQRADLTTPGLPAGDLQVRARYPGAIGNRLVTFTFHLGANILDKTQTPPLRGVDNLEVVWVASSDPSAPTGADRLYWVEVIADPQGRPAYRLRPADENPGTPAGPGTIDYTEITTRLTDVRVVSVGVTIQGSGRFQGRFDFPKTYEDLTFHPGRLAPTARRTLTDTFDPNPVRRSTALWVPIVLETDFTNGAQVAALLAAGLNMANTGTVLDALAEFATGHMTDDSPPRRVPVTPAMLSTFIELRGGNDGRRPNPDKYEGLEVPPGSSTGLYYVTGPQGAKNGLLALEDLEDISILAAPGSTFGALNGYSDNSHAITGLLLAHCERMRYRVVVLDSPDGAVVGEIRDERARLDSKYGALYYPWVRAFDPITENELAFPPSGYVTGIYARSDSERGVHKAPANEVIRLATGFETLINKGQQEVLNPLGVNCLRFFEGRGFRVWGARGITSDGEWRYINLRRNFAYLGRSIEIGTQWAVFEPNAEELWSNVRRSVEDFLYNEWKSARLAGVSPEEAFFVRCDRTTMTQDDIDSGRMICLVGVALLKPAEFVIFRIGQKTLDFKS